ncbi:hypothetical protein Trydic_g3910 [Trypoxylus dichotomus]
MCFTKNSLTKSRQSAVPTTGNVRQMNEKNAIALGRRSVPPGNYTIAAFLAKSMCTFESFWQTTAWQDCPNPSKNLIGLPTVLFLFPKIKTILKGDCLRIIGSIQTVETKVLRKVHANVFTKTYRVYDDAQGEHFEMF